MKKPFSSLMFCLVLSVSIWIFSCVKEEAEEEEEEKLTCIDSDKDGYGENCTLGEDCDDTNPSIHHLAPELCDGVDNQCPQDPGYGYIDEGCPWAKRFGGDYGDEEAIAILPTDDGGYIIAGDKTYPDFSNTDILVIKLDSSGNRIWNRVFGGTDYEYASGIQKTQDGGYIVSAWKYYYETWSYDSWLIKIDPSGYKVWEKTFGKDGDDLINSIQLCVNGRYIVAGARESAGEGNFDIWVMLLNDSGDIVFEKTFGGTNFDWANHIEQTEDGGYILAGETESFGEGEGDAWVIKLNSSGKILWDRTFGSNKRDRANFVKETEDNEFIVAGSTYSYGEGENDAWVIKLDRDGNKIWEKTFGGKSYDEVRSIVLDRDGGYTLAGDTYSFGAGYDDFWIIKLDKDGNKLWEKTFGGAGYDWVNSIQKTSDNGYVLVGVTTSFGAGWSYDIWAIKLDSDGNCEGIGCPSEYIDSDSDGYPSTPGYAVVVDCDDTNPFIHPWAMELCDGIDNQCPEDWGYGFIDEGCAMECVYGTNSDFSAGDFRNWCDSSSGLGLANGYIGVWDGIGNLDSSYGSEYRLARYQEYFIESVSDLDINISYRWGQYIIDNGSSCVNIYLLDELNSVLGTITRCHSVKTDRCSKTNPKTDDCITITKGTCEQEGICYCYEEKCNFYMASELVNLSGTLVNLTGISKEKIKKIRVEFASYNYQNTGADAYWDYLFIYPADITCKDNDQDGYFSTSDCGVEIDCNDNDPFVYPNAYEFCDGIDNQCPGDLGYENIDENCNDEYASSISIGDSHICIITTEKTAKCFGNNNDFGQLGNGTNFASPEYFLNVAELSEDVIDISAGYYHTCAVTSAGSAKCWGNNVSGELGNDSTLNSNVAVDVVELSSRVVDISAGAFHTCAITSKGGLKCWGYNFDGQLGDGTNINRKVPVNVIGLSSGVVAVATGYGHTCALVSSGAVKCWGYNAVGQLGDGTTTSSNVPRDVVGLSQGVIDISAVGLHSCALTSSGGVKCWGYNVDGELGNGTRDDSNVPVDVYGLSSDVVAITTGMWHSCALTSSSVMKCWGYNGALQLGTESWADSKIPADVIYLDSAPISIYAGGNSSCVLYEGGNFECWGWLWWPIWGW